MKCKICKNYDFNKNNCSQCEFKFDEELYWNNDEEWDILNMDGEYEWEHLQIQYRLKSKNIECLAADIWWDNNLAYVLGAKASAQSVAEALGVHKECVYDAVEMPLIIINLFKEKYIRGILSKEDIK